MTPQERQLIDDLFDRLSKLEGSPRDPDAVAAIAQGLRAAPNAVYALVQTVLIQDEALKRANAHIQELEAAGAQQPAQSGSFLDTMRDAVFGQGQGQGSVPSVRPPDTSGRPVWNSGQVLQQSQSPGRYDQGPYNQGQYNQGPSNQGSYNQGSYGQPYGAAQGPGGSPIGGAGGSFLGTAAAAAAGVVGGSMLLNSIRSMMGGSHQALGDVGNRASNSVGDQSGSDLARDAGVKDIGSSGNRDNDNSRSGLFDSASNDDHDDDQDSDGFGDDGDSDYA